MIYSVVFLFECKLELGSDSPMSVVCLKINKRFISSFLSLSSEGI